MNYTFFLIGLLLTTACSHINPTNSTTQKNQTSWSYPNTERSVASLDKNPYTKKLFLTELSDEDQFHQLAQNSDGVIRQGETVKVFIDNRDYKKPNVYFMNANYCPTEQCKEPPAEAVFHYHFAQKTLKGFALSIDQYSDVAYYTKTVEERKFFDIRLQKFTIEKNGIDETYYGLRFIERDLVNNQLFQHALTEILKNIKIPNLKLALILNSESQKIDTIKPWLESQNISYFTMNDILSGIDFIGLNPGVAYGYLRVFPENEEDLEPTDIPVFQTLPLDLSVVAGTLSTEFQDLGSHINLKSKERGTPNMVIRNPTEINKLKNLNNKPVRIEVSYQGYQITESNADTVRIEYQKKINTPWIKVEHTNESQLIHFDEMCKKSLPKNCLEKSRSYGGKVAGLGFLAHPAVAGIGSDLQKKYKYRLTPMGFGVPLSYYDQFMQYNLNNNAELLQLHTQLINSEMGLKNVNPLQPAERKEIIKKIKNLILKSPIPKDLYQNIYQEALILKEKVKAQYPTVDLDNLKIRSSSNAEDIKGFNGAGLHDSYSAKISKSTPDDYYSSACHFELDTDSDTGLTEDDVKPKSIACAMKAAYASLWNVRAVRERTYKRFDQRTAAMGLSIQTSYKFRKELEIKSNSVMITRVLGTNTVYGQQLSTQVGNGLVTNPVPETKSELLVIGFDNLAKNYGLSVLQYAKPKVEQPTMTTMILSEKEIRQISEMARDVEIKYCEAKSDYFPGANCKLISNSTKKPTALDMEFKQYSNGEILIKQVRTFTGR